MSRLQELREKKLQLAKEIRGMADKVNAENRNFTAEENDKWAKVNNEYNDVASSIDVLERADAVTKAVEGQRQLPGNEDTDDKSTRSRKGKREKRAQERQKGEAIERAKALALQAWAFRGAELDLTDDQKDACKSLGVNPRHKNFLVKLDRYPNKRAQSVGTSSAGGYTVPTGFVATLEKALKDYNAVRGVADVMRTDGGEAIPWPTANDTSQTGELLAENTEVAYQDITFGQTTFNAYKFSSKCIKISNELLADSAIDMADVIAEILGERLGRVQATYNTTGTGSSQPAGVVAGSTLGKTAASATAIAADEILDLIHSVDPAYRTGNSVGFMMHDNIMLAIRKLKDTANQYLWQPSNQMGVPDRLLGYPIFVNQNMQSSIATGTKTILFGDFSKFKIRDVGTVRLRRLDERFAELDQVAFIAFARMDSKLLNAGGNPVKHLIQA